ncbi:hypothetical protein [Halosimplex sp. TS25]|uniref:hypothetical protein n=1 Tax=Halosimplex rarum TaxID=3396619 RepID=UPI0039EB2BFB
MDVAALARAIWEYTIVRAGAVAVGLSVLTLILGLSLTVLGSLLMVGCFLCACLVFGAMDTGIATVGANADAGVTLSSATRRRMNTQWFPGQIPLVLFLLGLSGYGFAIVFVVVAAN